MLEESCLIVAGEKSGEEHAMSFLSDLLVQNPNLNLFGVGGDEMANSGVDLIYHLKDFSSWGVSEVIHKIPFYFNAADKLIDEVKKRNCKTAILVDFQTFNLKLSKRLKNLGVKVLYYVAPQAWAWKEWRVKPLSRNVHTLFTILPFEKKWFLDRGVAQVKSVPHPLYHHYKKKLGKHSLGISGKPFEALEEEPRILCLPGSRNFEVKNLLPEFVKTIQKLPKAKKGIVISPNVDKSLYEPYLQFFDFVWKHEDLSDALEWTHLAIAASGTVTLTCALFEVPTVVCYSSSLLNAYIFYTFLDYQWYISLANIVHDDLVFPELVQEHLTSYNIINAVKNWIENKGAYESVKVKLEKTKNLIDGEIPNIGEYMASIMSSSEGESIEHR
ncbi:MAG: lipid-A-disaccharide synthase [Halobacteriovoraceae bacterium]|nr:lipid-A-disaccharide synthase [Halobacteriovoraceae bacterium]